MKTGNASLPAGIVVIIVLISQASFASDEIFQLWTSVSATTELNEDWEVTFSEGLRFADNASRFYYNSSSLSLNYSGFGDWVEVGFGFRKIFMKQSSHSWITEDRPYFDVELSGAYSGLDLINRGRLEFRDREDEKDIWRYRNKFTIEFPIRLTELKLQPYVSDEVFINFDEEHFYRNKLYVGVAFDLFGNTECKVYYLYQSTKSSGTWDDINVVGVNLSFYY